MINISSATPVSWPTPPSTAVAPVGPATPVKPVQGSGRDPQADVEARREARLPAPKAGAPRMPDADTGDTLPRDAGAVAPGQMEDRARQEAAAQRTEQAIKKAEADKAGHKKAMERLQDVLSSMWAASGAVVDQALGLTPGSSDLPGNQSDTAPDLSAVAASTMSRRLLPQAPPQSLEAPEQPPPQGMSWPVMPPAAEEPASLAAPEVPGGEVIAYDEHGNSSLAPLEAGSIISERV